MKVKINLWEVINHKEELLKSFIFDSSDCIRIPNKKEIVWFNEEIYVVKNIRTCIDNDYIQYDIMTEVAECTDEWWK